MTETDDMVIDVLLPYYGDVGLMKEAVASVMAQTYGDWRLLVFDDGYPDAEPERFFTALSADDGRVHYQRNAENLGANENYRRALAAVTADYYVMMGADDVMGPEFLADFVAAWRREGAMDMYHPFVGVIDEAGRAHLSLADRIKRRLMPRQAGLYAGETVAASYLQGWHYFPAIVWRTEIAQAVGFNPHYDTIQDVYQGLDILQAGGKIYFDRGHTSFYYRRHRGSDSSAKALSGLRFLQEKRFFLEKESAFHALGWERAARAARHHWFSRLNAATLIGSALVAKQGRARVLLAHALNLD